MLPKTIKNLPRKLKIPKDIYKSLHDENRRGFWFISWLGRSYYKGDKIYREFYVSLCTNTYYFFDNTKTFCLEFPEEFSIRYKQGNYYLYDGEYHGSAYGSVKTSIIKNISLSRINNTVILDIYELFIREQSYYPLYNPDNYDASFISPYKDVPCYQIEIDSKKYIIPLNVIQSYFYAISSLSIYYLIYGILRDGLIPNTKTENTDLVPYRSSIINTKEANYFSKFFFLKYADRHSLNKIHDSFRQNLSNNLKDHLPLKSYIIYEFPFDKRTELKLDICFQPVNSRKNINIVYAIKNVHLASHSPLFNTNNFILDDLDASLKNDTENHEDNSGNIKITNIKNPNADIINGSQETNNNIIENIFTESDHPWFIDAPEIKTTIPSRIRETYGFQHQYINHINHYNDSIAQHNSQSNTGIVNFSIDSSANSYIDVITETFKRIAENNLFDCDYIFLRRYKNSLFSYDPCNNSENGIILLFTISYNNDQYCIIVKRNMLQRIGIIKRCEKGTFDKENDHYLRSGLIYIFRRYKKYNWSKLKTIQSISISQWYKFQIVHSLNKDTKSISREDKVNSLYRRITEFIISLTECVSKNQ
ncbi:hypothetical protein PF438_09510 [Elizabethkingia meningoseptica]|uniref:hypothetical protein n=1 Tax=Elizabethkingia meningoseptica TaxID=238 RepID=UPI0022F1710F|nr:hypothetical protein [Elizabethkingia meningoseptica]EJK5330252.1 hypothetical protein [Elizabethkingia meningoseptica]WBS73143.1 hypothetical protein PF438_09510 [Elizabethkingia meningoseptica]